jgi:hypothetical protein
LAASLVCAVSSAARAQTAPPAQAAQTPPAASAPAPAQPSDTFAAEYVSGKAGFDKKIKGWLVIGQQYLVFYDGHDKEVFSVQMANVTKASNAVENNTGGMGRKIMFGNLSNRSEGFVYVNTETADAAEALVFKVDQKAPAGIVAKIDFAAKKAKAK